jgi:DNA-binding SARP family transcriptional activator
MQHEYSGQLLDRAFLRLLPDVFFHPVWLHFVEAGDPLVPAQIQSLLDAGDELLSAGNLIEACQTLFICAFQQMRAGHFTAAANNIQRILVLAEQHDLLQVACWATWGAAAVCLRRGWFQQAAEHLEHLQSLLGEQHEWVLSDVIDIIRRALLSQSQAEMSVDQSPSSDAVLSFAFDQMLYWGTPRTVIAISANGLTAHEGRSAAAASLPGSAGPSLWLKVKRFFKGELRLKWVEARGSAPLPRVDAPNAPAISSPVALPLPQATPLLPQPDRPVALDHPAQPDRASEIDRVADKTPDHDQPAAIDQAESSDEGTGSPSIAAYLLGAFNFTINDNTVQNWPTGKGRAVFKYMLAHHAQPIPRDVLMDAFWPQAGQESARNSLNVALHGLRQALKTVTDQPVILFEEGGYGINSEFHIWVDVDEFDRHVQAGRRYEAKEQSARAIAEYDAAIVLYRGDFLSGDLYEEWPVLTRERLRVAYLEVLDRLSQIYFDQKQYAECVTLCQRTLVYDACREDVHGLLMRCYSRQGQHHLALRQYQACVGALRTELEVDPALETTQLYERIRRRERV